MLELTALDTQNRVMGLLAADSSNKRAVYSWFDSLLYSWEVH